MYHAETFSLLNFKVRENRYIHDSWYTESSEVDQNFNLRLILLWKNDQGYKTESCWVVVDQSYSIYKSADLHCSFYFM